jgi:hypothetical protein
MAGELLLVSVFESGSLMRLAPRHQLKRPETLTEKSPLPAHLGTGFPPVSGVQGCQARAGLFPRVCTQPDQAQTAGRPGDTVIEYHRVLFPLRTLHNLLKHSAIKTRLGGAFRPTQRSIRNLSRVNDPEGLPQRQQHFVAMLSELGIPKGHSVDASDSA